MIVRALRKHVRVLCIGAKAVIEVAGDKAEALCEMVKSEEGVRPGKSSRLPIFEKIEVGCQRAWRGGRVHLPMAPKSKTHIRSLMHLMFQYAARWELFNEQRNPIALVRVKNGTRRRVRPTIPTEDSFHSISSALREPYKTMVVIAQCLGLRVSEIAALQWEDFDFDKRQLLVQRSIVKRDSEAAPEAAWIGVGTGCDRLAYVPSHVSFLAG